MNSIRAFVAILMITWSVAAAGGQLKISSSAFSEGSNIPPKFTCDGGDTSPPLKIDGVSATAKSLVVIVDDPDAPTGLFTHWLVWNIDPKTNLIAEGSAAGGTEGKNDFGKSGYGGPCPPSGSHRYYLKVFALDRQLALRAGAKRKEVDPAIKGHVIGQGELMGRYARKR